MRKTILLAMLAAPTLAFAQTNFYAQTNHFALKPGQNWSWEQVAKTPNIKWEIKTPSSSDSNYFTYGDFGKYGHLTALGVRSKPTAINFASSKAYADDRDGDIYDIYQLFKKSELTKIKSNCDIKINSPSVTTGEYQEFYKWQKKGYRPLYLGVVSHVSPVFGGGVAIDYIIVKDFNDFNQKYIHIERYDANGNDITCKILK